MGFHVSLAELTKAATKLSQEAERLEEQLETAKKSVNKIITSEALTGQTGQAIYHQLNNVDAAILVGLADTTKLLSSDMYQLIAEFQASVGESSTTAVLDEDYLNQLKDQLSNFKNQHGEQEETIAGIYASVSDLISLSSPQSNYDTDSDAASQYLSNTIDKVTSFNSAGSELSSESLLTAIDSKVNQVSQTTSLSYSDSQYLSFVNDASFAKGIKSVNKQLKEQEKLAKEEAAKEAQAAWAKQHPVEAWLQSQAAKDAQFFEGARQTLEQTHWDYFGGALDKSLALSVLGFISKASETVDQLAIGIGELSHLTVEGLEMGVDYVTGHQTPQWIKDDITGATNNLLAASEFTDSLLALDAEAWGAVGKELGKIGTDFVTAVKTGDDYALGGYAFDVATLVGPASISKLKYVDEASALTKLTETSEVASTVGKVDSKVTLSGSQWIVKKSYDSSYANRWWSEQGYTEPPYALNSSVSEITLVEPTKFVRVYDGENSNLYGGWVMKAEDIVGLSPTQIQEKFALPNLPKYVGEVNLPQGVTLRVGEVNPLFGKQGGGTQFDLMGQYVGDFKELGKLPLNGD